MRRNQEIHEVGFLVFLLLVIVFSFIFFYFGLPSFMSSSIAQGLNQTNVENPRIF